MKKAPGETHGALSTPTTSFTNPDHVSPDARGLDWLKKATAKDDPCLDHVYGDGQQLWTTNGYVLHALDVATGRRGRGTVGEDGGLQVEKDGDIPPFAGALPQREPVVSIVVGAASLRAAAEGQEGFVRLSVYDEP